jgi:hypothetical protein
MRRKQIIKAVKEFAKAEDIIMRQAVYKAESLCNGKSLDYLSKNPNTIFTLQTAVNNEGE